eukprot:TRINITY_DN489_c0_g1_i1.p1 TRINITY_DN489_c0_g1~~TRINITY_DN489_c0_g1_i1.p1  ORF type:complete len:292 (-),score=84.05 TRINITY_DN489_c0_g1_i1:106-981(-)
MPKRVVVSDSDSDSSSEEEVPKKRGRQSQSQNSRSKKTPAKEKEPTKKAPDKEETNKMVVDLMRYALFLDYTKIPIKREDIRKNVIKEHKEKNISKPIIAIAQSKFRDIFGFDLVEVPKKGSKGGEGSGTFILKNCLNTQSLQWTEKDEHECGFLMTCLAIIFMNNGSIEQEPFYSQLRRIGLREGELHPVFGDWEKLIDKLVKEMYLERSRKGVTGEGRKAIEYRSGARSNLEIDKIKILEFIAKMYGEEQVDQTLLKELEINQERSDSESEEEEPSQVQSQRRKSSQRR